MWSCTGQVILRYIKREKKVLRDWNCHHKTGTSSSCQQRIAFPPAFFAFHFAWHIAYIFAKTSASPRIHIFEISAKLLFELEQTSAKYGKLQFHTRPKIIRKRKKNVQSTHDRTIFFTRFSVSWRKIASTKFKYCVRSKLTDARDCGGGCARNKLQQRERRATVNVVHRDVRGETNYAPSRQMQARTNVFAA